MLRLRLAPALVAVVVSAGLGLLAGCGDSQAPAYNDADVAFASEMAVHHQQAVEMTAMVDDRQVSPALRSLAEQIQDAQAPEIRTMTGWLEDWDKPTPTVSSDPDDLGDTADDMSMGGSMDGMMSPEDMDQLTAASDADFEPMWLAMMIEHHEGAQTMARAEIADGRFPDAVSLAKEIDKAQGAEIATMKAMLAR
jgi:uncharacterized protein (DUF305 family)